ncbi:hypothetical protein GGI24_003005 [Coemansia furcata]|nr:hypothetical protein GGI24_003005 [Coemansia furcata]
MASSKSKLSSSTTPHSQRFKPTADISHANSSKTELDTVAKLDAERLAEEKIRFDPDVLAMACPWDKAARTVAVNSTKLAAEALESFLHHIPGVGVSNLPPQLDNSDLRGKLTLLAEAVKPWLLPLTDDVADLLSKEKAIYLYFRDFVLFVMECLKALHADSDIPAHYRLLLPNSTGSDSKGKDSTQGLKVDQVLVLRPWSDTIGQGVKDWHYADILAVAEAKVPDSAAAIKSASSTAGTVLSSFVEGRVPSKRKAAQGQMLCYSRPIYEYQHNRILIWGLTICGSLVRIYNSGPDCALSSADLDMRDAGGRRQFVEWLVCMSLGEDEQRGFNPAVQFVDDKQRGKYWKIDVPAIVDEGYHSDFTDHVTPYYSRGPTVVAGSSFGRNTRGFPATKDIDNIDRPDVFVKTAWQHTERKPNSTRLSELDCLRLIKKEFGSGKDGINVPILVAGGVMAKRLNDGSFVPLTTDAFYSSDILQRHEIVESSLAIDDEPNPLAEPSQPPLIAFRQQYALVTDKICEPLKTVKTADELIVVLFDAMRAHSWILENCGLLHRDISPNNIMVGRNKAANDRPSVYGMLIDFDCAINPNLERTARPERTGTKPFMSVANLEGHPEQRTELDDWESLLYVLCWVATFGINATDRGVLAKAHKEFKIPLEISLWHASSDMVAIAAKKRNHLHALDFFTTNITDRFPIQGEDDKLPDYFSLQCLAIDLYEALFQNPDVNASCRGALKKKDIAVVSKRSMHRFGPRKDGGTLQSFKNMTIESSGSTDDTAKSASNDPFVNRMEDSSKSTIIERLKGVLEYHAGIAKDALTAVSSE